MLYQIVSFLLDVVGGLLTGACLLRLYMQWQRVPFGNPVGRLVFALTDWLILPLRRAIPPARAFDWAAVAGAVWIAACGDHRHHGLAHCSCRDVMDASALANIGRD